jgi:hypothetical protein
MDSMKKSLLALLVIIGLITIIYNIWHLTIYASDKNGFWFSYYCSDVPVTTAETDKNNDGYVQREEALEKCSNLWLLRRDINGKACIEYMGSKVGIPLMTACRLSKAEEKFLNEQDIIKP